MALVGSTGQLGQLIGRAVVDKPGVQLRILVRPSSLAKAGHLRARGAQVVEGDITTAGSEALTELCAGATSVISAVQGGPREIIDGQLRVLDAARAAGVGRFIASTFSVDLFGMPDGANISLDVRRAFARLADRESGEVEVVHPLNGCFIDRNVLFGFLGAVDLEKSEAHLWGDGDAPMDFTTYADTAGYAAEAALDVGPLPSHFKVAGDVLNFHGLVAAYREGAGRDLTIRHHGSLQDLDDRIAHVQSRDPANIRAYLPLMYWRAMLNGTGKLHDLVNDRYPDVRPTTVAKYVAREFL